jgi:hypothetical protein
MPSAAPCTSAESRQYDFWLGNWGYTAQGAFPGSNVITRDEQGCVIEENFSQQVYRGRSVNVYDPVTAKWHQTYIDTEGNRMVLIGTYTGDRLTYETQGGTAGGRSTRTASGSRWRSRRTAAPPGSRGSPRSTRGGDPHSSDPGPMGFLYLQLLPAGERNKDLPCRFRTVDLELPSHGASRLRERGEDGEVLDHPLATETVSLERLGDHPLLRELVRSHFIAGSWPF